MTTAAIAAILAITAGAAFAVLVVDITLGAVALFRNPEE